MALVCVATNHANRTAIPWVTTARAHRRIHRIYSCIAYHIPINNRFSCHLWSSTPLPLSELSCIQAAAYVSRGAILPAPQFSKVESTRRNQKGEITVQCTTAIMYSVQVERVQYCLCSLLTRCMLIAGRVEM